MREFVFRIRKRNEVSKKINLKNKNTTRNKNSILFLFLVVLSNVLGFLIFDREFFFGVNALLFLSLVIPFFIFSEKMEMEIIFLIALFFSLVYLLMGFFV